MPLFLKKIYDRFIRIRGNPREIALGFALGLFIGFTPTMGIQIAMGVFFAALLKWNKIAAAIGVQVTNPLTAPFVYSFTYFIGAKLIGLERTFVWTDVFDLTKALDMLEKAPGIILALTIGGIIVGAPIAWAGYLISHAALEKYQKSIKDKLMLQKKRIKGKLHSRKSRKKRK